MAALVVAEAGARGLSFLFYVIAARELAPSSFGVVRYTIVLATFASVLVGVLSVAVTRDLGEARSDPAHTADTLGSTVVAVAVIGLATIAGAWGAAQVGLTGAASVLGLCATLIGYTAFTMYYAVARGLGQIGRAAGSYLGASAVQLTTFLVLVVTLEPSATTALLVFGLSSLVPILLLELVRPVLRKRRLRPSMQGLRRIRRIAAPLVIAQIAFLFWQSADQVWVEQSLGIREVGIYGTARNLAQVFFILPAGVSGVLMPRVAELRVAGATLEARRLIRNATVGLLGLSFALGLPVALGASSLLGFVYGDAYASGASTLAIIVGGTVVNAGFMGLTTAAVGWGRSGLFTLGMLVAAVVEGTLLLTIDGGSSTSAAWAFTASITVGFAAVLLRLTIRPLREDSSTRARHVKEA